MRNFKKVNAGKRNRPWEMHSVTTSNWTVRGGPTQLMAFEQRIEGGKKAGPTTSSGRIFQAEDRESAKSLRKACAQCVVKHRDHSPGAGSVTHRGRVHIETSSSSMRTGTASFVLFPVISMRLNIAGITV